MTAGVRRWLSYWVFGVISLVAVSALADSQTWPTGTEGLLADTERVVSAFEDEGWFVDRHAFEQIEPILLESLCRATPDARAAALRVLQHRARLDPRELYIHAGREKTSEVKEALAQQRQWLALKRTNERASVDCPFWVELQPEFTSRQTEQENWVVHLEGGGTIHLRRQYGEWDVGGGGNGRLLLGRGMGPKWSLLGGIAVGGGPTVSAAGDGQVVVHYIPSASFAVRYRNVGWLYELELAPAALFDSESFRLSWGGRVGVTIGVGVLRTLDFLPWAGVAITAEHFEAGGGRPVTQYINAGLRFGFRWLP